MTVGSSGKRGVVVVVVVKFRSKAGVAAPKCGVGSSGLSMWNPLANPPCLPGWNLGAISELAMSKSPDLPICSNISAPFVSPSSIAYPLPPPA